MMQDPYGLDASQLPPELIAQLLGNRSRKQIAEAMLKQSMQAPEVQQPKGRFQGAISPLEIVSKLAQGVAGNRGIGAADAEQQRIAGAAEQGRAGAMRDYQTTANGLPGVLPNDDEGNAMPGAANPRKAIMDALGNAYLKNSPFLKWEMDNLNRREGREDQQAFLREQRVEQAKARAAEIEMRLADAKVARDEKAALMKELAALRASMGGGGQPYFTPVPTTGGIGSFNNRTGKMELLAGPDGAPLVKPADSPTLQADIARGKKEGAGAGESNTAQFEVAQTAAMNLPKIDRLINHLQTSQAITGPAAEVLTGLEKAKQLVMGSEAAGKKVTDTQIADILMGSEVFPLIKELGIGARGMDTPAEREFMRSVLTGTTALNKETLVRMAQMRRQSAMDQINRWNERLDKGELEDFYRNTKRTRERLGARPAVTTGGAPSGFRVLGVEKQ